ncbi:hypothetical protein L1887_25330 [Cichorium endivia]|nr:hypothetical protein L1887_25330 [Cichorium endivia]
MKEREEEALPEDSVPPIDPIPKADSPPRVDDVAIELQEPVGDDNGENNTVGTEDANADVDPRVPPMDRREDTPPRFDDQQPEEESSASCHCALV